MRYKSEYPDSYKEGIRNKSFSISSVASELLDVNDVDNESAFVNDLIINALQEKEFFKKKLMAQITTARKELKDKFGIDIEVKKIDV